MNGPPKDVAIRHAKVIKEYIKTGSKKLAYMKVYPNASAGTAHVASQDLFARPDIQAKLHTALERAGLSIDALVHKGKRLMDAKKKMESKTLGLVDVPDNTVQLGAWQSMVKLAGMDKGESGEGASVGSVHFHLHEAQGAEVEGELRRLRNDANTIDVVQSE